MDRLATSAECRKQGAYCRKRADESADQNVRALWIAMAQMWTKLAEQADQATQRRPGALMPPYDKPKSRLQAHAPTVRSMSRAHEGAHSLPWPEGG